MERRAPKIGRVSLLTCAMLALSAPTSARSVMDAGTSKEGRGAMHFLQCVPYARQLSGIRIFGDARTWWNQAEGRYHRGNRPAIGAVMAFKPYGRMELGHVATVSRIIDGRTVLLRHANWSPINGHRGQVELDVQAIDVSSGNTWSAVRVWYNPIGGLGSTAWPVQGFIFNGTSGGFKARAPLANRVALVVQPATRPQAPPNPMAAPAASQNWRLQLGAFAVRANAESLSTQLRSRPELADHPQQLIQSGKVTKLQASNFTNAEVARATCRGLVSVRIACIVTR